MTKSARMALELASANWATDWSSPSDVANDILNELDRAGFVIVPKEPSEEMKDAGFKAIFEPESCLSDIEIEDVYRAMIHPTNNEGEK